MESIIHFLKSLLSTILKNQQLIKEIAASTFLLLISILFALAEPIATKKCFKFTKISSFKNLKNIYQKFFAILTPLLILMFVKLLEILFNNRLVSILIFKNIAIAWLGIKTIEFLLVFSHIKNKKKTNIFVYGIIVLATIASISSLLFPEYTSVAKWFVKIPIAILILTVTFSIAKPIASFIGKNLIGVAGISRHITTTFYIISFLVTLLWIYETLTFTKNIVIGFALLLLIFNMFFISKNIAEYIIEKFIKEIEEHEFPAIIKLYAFRFINFLFIGLLFLVLQNFMFLSILTAKLENYYIINSDIVKISLFTLIQALYTFFVLFYLLSLATEIVKFYITSKHNTVHGTSIASLIYNLGILIVVIISLSKLGITWKLLIPLASALGIGVGFGIQTIMNSYISGFILLFSGKLKVNDLIELEGNAGSAIGNDSNTIFGKVTDIGVVSTTVRTLDGVEIAIPNSEFISGKIINYSLSNPYVRVRVPFYVAYSSDIEKVREVILNVLRNHPAILQRPQPEVWFYNMDSSSLVFMGVFWVNISQWYRINVIRSSIYIKGWFALKEAGIEIPFTQNDVWFRNSLKVKLEDNEK